jgi:zinc protease
MMKAVETATVTPYVARTSTAPLLDKPPAAGKVTRISTRDRLGVTEWELSNGARVVLKPTTFKEDEIVFLAMRPGGTSLASDADFVPAQTSAQVVSTLGVGKFASADLRRVLTGEVVSVRPIIAPYLSSLAGGGSRRDVERLFQLIYLYFTQPRRDPAIFSALTTQLRSALANQTATPDFAFASTMISALTQDHLRSRPTTRETIDAMDMDKSLAFYRDRFSDASGFTFVFVGSFDVEAMRPLVEQYLGGLPSTRRPETWRDVGIRAPAGIVEKRVAKGIEPRSRTSIVFTGPMPYDLEHTAALRAAADVLQTRLRNALREALSATYNVTVTSATTKRPSEEYSATISFQSDPARMEALSARVFEEIARFKSGGPTPQELADAKAGLLRDFETSSRQNAYWLAQLAARYELGDSPETLLQVPDSYRQLSAASVQEAARVAFDTNRYVKVTLVPEK